MKKLKIKNALSVFNPFTSTSMAPTLAIVYILITAFFAIQNPIFIHLKNYQVIATNIPFIGIVTMGLGVVLLTGNVDLSVGSLASFVSVIVALLLRDSQLPIFLIILIGMLLGVAIGAFNGFIVNYVGVNSVITTLGMWAALKGLSQYFSGGTIFFTNKIFQNIGRGYTFKVIPNVLLYMIVILIIMYAVLRFTQFGKNIYLVGANSVSARSVGINVKKTKFLAFLFSSGFAALAGILVTSQVSNASYGTGTGWEFRALTICIIGGISLSGGRGTFVGLFLSLLIIGSLSNGLTMINMLIYWRNFFEGAILILAIMLDSRRVKGTAYTS